MNDLKFANWTLNTIRKDGIAMSWFEERRFDWCQIAYRFVLNVINGYSIIICTDSKRKWFGDYVIGAINSSSHRPLIPIFNINNISMDLADINLGLLEDMLSISFSSKHIVWYIGLLDNKFSNLAIESNNNFIWSFNGGFHTSFDLREGDANNDIKLLQLFKILDRTIDAVMFNEIENE